MLAIYGAGVFVLLRLFRILFGIGENKELNEKLDRIASAMGQLAEEIKADREERRKAS